jgi:DNA gyrase subunit A
VSDNIKDLNTTSSIAPVVLEDEMKKSYLDYAMSVIVSRALPDVRDGLKPVHRRILYSMKEGGFDYNKPYKKSARIVGDVMGKYHPHGDGSIYNAMVRMAQDFSMRVPLVDGQGNYGSMDGDEAAAMRYTEARLSHVAHYMLHDIDKDTVDFQPNYDESAKEPVVLPARFPNLLVNGAGGIAVGMATNIPPHNLGEVIDACCAYIDNHDITIEELIQIVPGPDFPTGGIILGRRGILDAYKMGRGSITMRSKTHIEEIRKDREAIIITEIPYQVNKARMVERIAETVNAKIVEGISDLRDESDRNGVRVVIEIKKDADASVVLNQLYKHTPVQTSFGINTLALNGGKPETMSLKDIIYNFIRFREDVIARRTRFELRKARDKAHTLLGLAIAVANIDEIISIVRAAKDPAVAREQLMAKSWPTKDIGPLIRLVETLPESQPDPAHYTLTETQARAILDLRLHKLTGLEREKISDELHEIIDQIKEYLSILSNRDHLFKVLKEELIEVKEKFSTPRRSEFSDEDITTATEDLIQQEDMVVTVSHNGYIKRVPLSTYRAQHRGGKGRSGMGTRDEDFVERVFVAHTHTPILFFSDHGLSYALKVYMLPIGSATSLGKAMVNILPLSKGEKITTIMAMPEDESQWEDLHIMFATSKGTVRRNKLSDFTNIRANGKIAMKLESGESLVNVSVCDEDSDVFLATYQGKCIRFPVTDIRVFAGRNSMGVRGIKLAKDDRIISMSILQHNKFTIEERDDYLKKSRALRAEEIAPEISLSDERFNEMQENEQFLLTITEKGFGKRSSTYEYRLSSRGGMGIANMEITSKTGLMVGSVIVEDSDDIMLVTNGGKLIRSPINQVRIAGRKTQGVRLFRIDNKEKVVSADCIREDDGTSDQEDTNDETETSIENSVSNEE